MESNEEITAGDVFTQPVDDRVGMVVFLGIGLSTLVLAYFYAADHVFFSTRYMTQIFQILLLNDAKTAWLTLCVCLLAACCKNPTVSLTVVDFIASHMKVLLTTVVTTLALAALIVYHDNAFSMDEYAELFQAKIFSAGRLTANLPPSVVDWLVPLGFNGGFLLASHATGEAISCYWPGFSLILSIFEVLRMPWLCNPCLSALAVFLIHRITLEITGERRAAAWAVLFTLASGAFLAYGISYYSMQARLVGNLLFVWLLLKPGPYRSFGAGLAGSFALITHSPFPHALFAAPWIIAMARSEEQRKYIWPVMLGYLPLLVIIGASWLRLRANITAGNAAFLDPVTGIASAVFSIPDKSMFDMRVAAIAKLWIWAVPGLFVFAWLGRVRFASDYRVRLLTQSAILTFVGYIFVIFDQGHGWGYRYMHSAWGVVPILAGCALAKPQQMKGRLTAFAGAAAILNLLIVVPYQMTQISTIIARHSAQLPNPHRPGNTVYFIRDSGGFYRADLAQIDPYLRSKDLILFSRGPELDAQLRRQNWPQAVEVTNGKVGVEEWYLGPTDPRRPEGPGGARRFMLTYSKSGTAH